MRLTITFPFAVLILFLLACNLSQLDDRAFTVEYVVDGTARSAHVTYTNKDGGTEMENVELPWSKTFQARSGHFLYISAQISYSGGGVQTEIKANGKTFKEAYLNGAHNIASVNGSCCPQQ